MKYTGKNNSNWRGGISKKKSVCELCGKYFECVAYTPGKFCSRLCLNRDNAKQSHLRAVERKKLLPKKVKKVRLKKRYFCKCGKEIDRKQQICSKCRHDSYFMKVECKNCGGIIKTYKSRARSFCSKKCQLKYYKGKGNPNYIDGRNPINKAIRDTKKYHRWRISIFQRDDFTCKLCGQAGWELHAHHVKQFAFYPELRFDINNGITLCKKCHLKIPKHKHKTPKRKNAVTLPQWQFLDMVSAHNGIAGVATSEEEALEIIKEGVKREIKL